jgi:hypothetical protein
MARAFTEKQCVSAVGLAQRLVKACREVGMPAQRVELELGAVVKITVPAELNGGDVNEWDQQEGGREK